MRIAILGNGSLGTTLAGYLARAGNDVTLIVRPERLAELRDKSVRVSGLADFATSVRWASGAVFVLFGIGKFSDHGHEVESFESYGLPSPDAFVYLIGVLEIGGGLLLFAGLATRLVALALAGNMAGAIVVSGIGEGEVLPSLTLAPALLLAMLFLIWTGSGLRSLDERMRTRWSP
jgi:putative oxidoreductase